MRENSNKYFGFRLCNLRPKKFQRCAFSLVTRLVMLQKQSSLRFVKVLTGEFTCKNLLSIFLLGSLKWNSRFSIRPGPIHDKKET